MTEKELRAALDASYNLGVQQALIEALLAIPSELRAAVIIRVKRLRVEQTQVRALEAIGYALWDGGGHA